MEGGGDGSVTRTTVPIQIILCPISGLPASIILISTVIYRCQMIFQQFLRLGVFSTISFVGSSEEMVIVPGGSQIFVL